MKTVDNQVIELTVQPFEAILEKCPRLPALMQRCLNNGQDNLIGRYFQIIIDQENQKTDFGITNANRLRIVDSQNPEKEFYNSGFRVWHIDNCLQAQRLDLKIEQIKIIGERSHQLLFGLINGQQELTIFKFYKQGILSEKAKFNLVMETLNPSNGQSIANYQEFKQIVYLLEKERHLSRSLIYQSEDLCLLLIKHADKANHYVHDRFKLYFWLKNQGVVSTDWLWTNLFPVDKKSCLELVAEASIFFNEQQATTEILVNINALINYDQEEIKDYLPGWNKHYLFKLQKTLR